ncbi:MAG: branched-chain amino acid ABC transporter substrate-binding protein [Pseudomonadota bacterium]
MPFQYRSAFLGGVFSFVAVLPAAVSAEITIGFAGPLSGSVALNGEQMDVGAQRAVADLNAAGGVLGQTVKLISADDACDVDQAVAVAKRLVAAKVSVVIGHLCSRTTIAASDVYDEAGVLVISPASTNPLVTDRGLPTIFRTIGRDDDQAAVAAEFLMSEFPDKSIALLHDGNTYGRGLAEGVKAALNTNGVAEVLFAEFAADQVNYATTVERLVAAKADVVYATSNAVNDIALMIRQFKAAQPGAILVSADVMASDGFLFIAGEAAAGTYFTFGPDARANPAAASVVETFRDEEAYEPEGYTLYSYAAVQAWALAAEAARGVETQDVAAQLKASSFNTVIGDISFDDKGDVTGVENFIMYVWGEEQYAPVQ